LFNRTLFYNHPYACRSSTVILGLAAGKNRGSHIICDFAEILGSHFVRPRMTVKSLAQNDVDNENP
jgi:hypothetical protein